MNFIIIAFMMLLSSPIFSNTEVELRRLIQNNPKNIQAYSDLIELATTRAQIVKFGNEALAAIGPRFQIYTSLGNAYLKAQDYNNAINSYRTAVSLNPRSATGFNRLGLALMRLGYFRQAEVAFRSAMAYSRINTPSNLMYKTHWGLALENLKEYDKAKKVIGEVLIVNPSLNLALEAQRRLAQTSTQNS